MVSATPLVLFPLTSIYFASPRLCCPDSQNTRSSPDIHYYLILKDSRVSKNGRVIGSHTVVIRKHLLLVIELSIRTEVICKITGLRLFISVEGGDFSVAGGVGKGRGGRIAF